VTRPETGTLSLIASLRRVRWPGPVQTSKLGCLLSPEIRLRCAGGRVGIPAVPAIPATLTGKKMEVPVRKILLGASPDDAANRDAMANPQALDAFARYASTQRDYRLGTTASAGPAGVSPRGPA